MGKIIDLTGKRFGMWTVLGKGPVIVTPGSRSTTWHCVCDCGTSRNVNGGNLRYGVSMGCGCTSGKSRIGERHGMSGHPLYATWHAMVQRCEYRGHRHYGRYGGRGIRVCRRWRDSFRLFVKDMGERPAGMQLDRKNNDRDYSPENCRWVDTGEQQRNRGAYNRLLTKDGRTQTAAEWGRELGLSNQCLHQRLRRGESDERALRPKFAK